MSKTPHRGDILGDPPELLMNVSCKVLRSRKFESTHLNYASLHIDTVGVWSGVAAFTVHNEGRVRNDAVYLIILTYESMISINSLLSISVGIMAIAAMVPVDIQEEAYFSIPEATGNSFGDKSTFAKGILSGIGCTGNKRLDTIKVAFSDCDGKPMGTLIHAAWTPDPAPYAPLLGRLQRRVWHQPQSESFYTFNKGEGIIEMGARLCKGSDSKGEICQLRMVTNMGKTLRCGSAHNTEVETVWKRIQDSKNVVRHFSGFTTSGTKPGFTRVHILAAPAVCKKE